MFSPCYSKAGIRGMDLACIKSFIEQPRVFNSITIGVLHSV